MRLGFDFVVYIAYHASVGRRLEMGGSAGLGRHSFPWCFMFLTFQLMCFRVGA
jgi:hypothetical protein